jgi:putative ABC transport system substrate-binding protein
MTTTRSKQLLPLAGEPGAGVVLLPDIFTVAHHQLVIALAARYRVPTVYSYRFMVERGGLISYGVDIDNLFERAATYVDRILKGAKPADLPSPKLPPCGTPKQT